MSGIAGVTQPPREDLRLQVTALGDEPLDATFTLKRGPMPAPERLGPEELLIEIRAASISWVDLMMLSGQYQQRPALPYTPGLEYSGVVLAGGDTARGSFQPGDRVFVDCLGAGPRSGGAYERWGGCARYGIAPRSSVHQLPAPLSFSEAAIFSGAYETAYHCLIERAQLQPGERLLLHGATGATGLAALQIAHAVGAEVIATGRSIEKLQELRTLVASLPPERAPKLHLLPLPSAHLQGHPRALRDALEALLGPGARADLCYDPIGGPLSAASLRCLRFGGRHLVVGWTSTPRAGRRIGASKDGGRQGVTAPANQLPSNLILMKGIDVLGCPMVISTQKHPALRPPRLAALQRWAEEGKIKPHCSLELPLGAYRQLLSMRQSASAIGGTTLLPWAEEREELGQRREKRVEERPGGG